MARIDGTRGNDNLVGTDQADLINSGEGHDTIDSGRDDESVDFYRTKNLFIEGDKLLQEPYNRGKVKVNYIDSPFNTGNDFIYEHHFAKSAEESWACSSQQE